MSSFPASIMSDVSARARSLVTGAPPSFAGSVAATFATRVAGIGIGVLTLTLTTRLLGPEGRGQFALTMAALALVLQFGNAGLHSAATYWLAHDARRRTGVGGLLAWFSFGPVAALCGAGAILLWYWPALLPDVPFPQLGLALLAGPPSMFLMLSASALLGLKRPVAFNLLDLAGKLAGAVAVLALLFWKDLWIVFAMYAGLHYLLAVGAYRQLLGRWVLPAADRAVARDLFWFGNRVYWVSLAMFLTLRIDLFMLNGMIDTSQAGLYSVAVQVGDILSLTASSIAAMLFPWLAAMDAGRRWASSMRVVRVTSVLLAAIAIGLGLLAKPLFVWWFGASFAGSAIALWWLLPGLWCLGINTLLLQHLAAFGMPVFLFVSTAASAVLNILLNLWAIPAYGLAGAAAVSSLTYGLLLAATVAYLGTPAGKAFRDG